MGRKVYTKEFKLGAVKLVADQKMTVSQVARDLGVSHFALRKWMTQFRQNGMVGFPGKGNLLPWDEEKRDLERRLRRAEMERDLLKKTIVFFAEHDRKGMTP